MTTKPTDQPAVDPLEDDHNKPNAAFQRTMVFIVVFLGLAIVAALAAIVLRVIYLAATPATQQETTVVNSRVNPVTQEPTSSNGPSASLPVSALALPDGAVVQSMALDQGRLAVHYQAPTGAGILIVDTGTGAVIRRLSLK